MATKPNTSTADKQRRQRIILAVAGVALIGLAAFQLPKLFGGDSSTTSEPAVSTSSAVGEEQTVGVSSPAPSSSTGASTSLPGAPTSSALPPVPTTVGPGGIFVGGVAVTPARTPKAGPAQLWSISRFQWKDPFVQQVKEDVSSSSSSPSSTSASPPPAPPAGSDSVSPGTTQSAAPGGQVATGKPKFATIAVNGAPVGVGLKQAFPASKQFTLVALSPTSATVTIKGGKVSGGNSVALQLNQAVTLVNDRTKDRYRLQLLYVGAVPEQVTSYQP
jgi:hypothetical protein